MTGRPSRLTASLVSALVVPISILAGCSAPAPGTPQAGAQPPFVQNECADLVILGARGSGQDPERNAGVGAEVRRSVGQLARRVHARSARTIRLEAVRYDASAGTYDAYQAHVIDGAAMMTARLRKLERSCPGSRFALVGFSQGAQVVHGTSVDVPTDEASRVALVAMIADPRHNPSDAITQFGYAKHPVTGNGRLGSGTPIAADLRRAAISLCVEGDEICNDKGAPGGPPSDTHRHFYEKESSARATATQLDQVLLRNGV